jgi:hypothetical protein
MRHIALVLRILVAAVIGGCIASIIGGVVEVAGLSLWAAVNGKSGEHLAFMGLGGAYFGGMGGLVFAPLGVFGVLTRQVFVAFLTIGIAGLVLGLACSVFDAYDIIRPVWWAVSAFVGSAVAGAIAALLYSVVFMKRPG